MKPSESKYSKIIKEARAIYEKHGSILPESADDFGINTLYPSKGAIEFIFYYSGLSRIATPDGYFVPLGSRQAGNEEAAMQECIEHFGLIHDKTTNQNYEQWNYYHASKNI